MDAPGLMEDNSSVLMEDNLTLCNGRVDNIATFSLYKEGITITEVDRACIRKKEHKHKIVFTEVIGCHCMRSRSDKPGNQLTTQTHSLTSSSSSESSTASSSSNAPMPASSSTAPQPAYFCIFWYPVATSAEGAKHVVRRPILVKVAKHKEQQENRALAEKWRKVIVYLVKGMALTDVDRMLRISPTKQKPILFLLNPKSGSGRSVNIYHNLLLPILSEGNVPFELITTTHSNHGREVVATQDLSKWRAIVVISGDGLVHEVFNGLFEREDWAEMCKIPVGIIPAGSGNGLANSVAYSNNEVTGTPGLRQACLRAARCKAQPMDIVCVEGLGSPIYACLSLGWGFISDVDIESERLRFIGEPRFMIWTIHRLAHLRYYKGRLSYLQAEGHQPASYLRRTQHTGSILKRSTNIKEPSHNKELSASDATTNLRDRYFSVAETNFESITQESQCLESEFQDVESALDDDQLSYQSMTDWNQFSPSPAPADPNKVIHTPELDTPRIDEPVPPFWVTVEDDFVIIYALCQPYITSYSLIAPSSQLDDGIIWLVIVRRSNFPHGISPVKCMAQFFLKMEKGEHGMVPGVEIIPVKAFRLEPLEKHGNMTIDGEPVPMGTIQGTVLPSLVRIIS